MKRTSIPKSLPFPRFVTLTLAVLAGGCAPGPVVGGVDDTPGPEQPRPEEPGPEEPAPMPTACTVSDTVELASQYDDVHHLPAGCYLARSIVRLVDGAVVTMDPGVTILFEHDAKLHVTEGAALTASGSAEQPILMTGTEARRGHWRGLHFDGSNSIDNLLEHIIIEHAGSDQYEAALTIGSGALVDVRHTVLRESATVGLGVARYTELGAFENNVITANSLGAAALDADVVGELGTSSTFAGNDVDLVFATAAGNRVEREATWPALDVPYRVDSRLFVYAPLTLSPGVAIEFDQGASMEVDGPAIFRSEGTAEAPVTLRGVEPTAGFWDGLVLSNTSSTNNLVQHTLVRDGGGYSHASGGAGNLVLISTSSSTPVRGSIVDSSFHNSAGFGIWIDGGSEIGSSVQTDNDFADNDAGAVHWD